MNNTRPVWSRASRCLLGLCGGVVVAIAWLFCVSAWGMAVPARGVSGGAGVFYGIWLSCIFASLGMGPTRVARGMGLLAGVAWLAASVGGVLHASASMRWHPVVLGVNLALLLLGLLCSGWGLGLIGTRRGGAR